jgi:hypothetical protein
VAGGLGSVVDILRGRVWVVEDWVVTSCVSFRGHEVCLPSGHDGGGGDGGRGEGAGGADGYGGGDGEVNVDAYADGGDPEVGADADSGDGVPTYP